MEIVMIGKKSMPGVLKFIFFEEKLVWGKVNNHPDLLGSEDPSKVIGAGVCNYWTGEVMFWDSMHLNVETPYELRPKIQELLNTQVLKMRSLF